MQRRCRGDARLLFEAVTDRKYYQFIHLTPGLPLYWSCPYGSRTCPTTECSSFTDSSDGTSDYFLPSESNIRGLNAPVPHRSGLSTSQNRKIHDRRTRVLCILTASALATSVIPSSLQYALAPPCHSTAPDEVWCRLHRRSISLPSIHHTRTHSHDHDRRYTRIYHCTECCSGSSLYTPGEASSTRVVMSPSLAA